MSLAAAIVVVLLVLPAVFAKDHVVGGSNGWNNQGFDYSTWSSGETFTVGDTLTFNYGGLHSVDQVSKDDYDNCNTGSALQSYSGGKNTIPLSNPGTMYFICPTGGHCASGMKLAVTVAGSGGSPTTPTTPATPSTPSTPSDSPSTPATPSGSSPPTPRSSYGNGAAGGNMNSLVIGFSVVFAALVNAFLG